MSIPIVTVIIASEYDMVAVRQRGREIAALTGFDTQGQTRIATALSEIARNAYQYAGGGKAEFSIDSEGSPQSLVVRISDKGPGVANLDRVLAGAYKSRTGMGMGIIGARRLMDGFAIESSPSGTAVTLRKSLPPDSARVTPQVVAGLVKELARRKPEDLLGQLRQQNQELMWSLEHQQQMLEQLRQRHEEVQRLNLELEETNRGVVALHAELEDRAERLRHADEMKSRFLSHMSHEFRTPLNAILALCRMLLGELDGPLAPEQQKQVAFIRDSGQNLYEMVNDLLDLAKIEAGRIEVRSAEFTVAGLFGTLRGMFKPLVQSESVRLVFDDPGAIPPLLSDETKISQILRNLVSNALKFTEQGEVRVSAGLSDERTVFLEVKDTGIGIAPEHQIRVFEEFAQVESPVQRKVKGTGLGLPLAKKLAELLGGDISLVSAPGVGSTFRVAIPVQYAARQAEAPPPPVPVAVAAAPRILIVDDEEVSRYVIRRALANVRCSIEEAGDGAAALLRVAENKPDLILLDLRMPEKDGFETLRELKASVATQAIPVVIITSKTLSAREQSLLEQAAAVVSKDVLTQDRAAEQLGQVLGKAGVSVG